MNTCETELGASCNSGGDQKERQRSSRRRPIYDTGIPPAPCQGNVGHHTQKTHLSREQDFRTGAPSASLRIAFSVWDLDATGAWHRSQVCLPKHLCSSGFVCEGRLGCRHLGLNCFLVLHGLNHAPREAPTGPSLPPSRLKSHRHLLEDKRHEPGCEGVP